MTLTSETRMAGPGAAIPPPRLRIAQFEDYPQIQRLEASHQLVTLPFDRWQDMWQQNPLWHRLTEQWPIGWVLEDLEGTIVGSLCNVPSLYRFEGRELICANGRAWVVSSDYRGFALWLMAEYFNQSGADLFINTTVNEQAVTAFSNLSARVPAGDWETASYWIIGYQGFARAGLRIASAPLPSLLQYPVAAALSLRDLFKPKPPPARSTSIEWSDGFDPRFDEFWGQLLRQKPHKLMGYRDLRWLNWHYAIPLRDRNVWILTATRNGLLRAYCILKRQNAPHNLRRMRLVDYQSIETDHDLLPGLLHAALERCAAEQIHALEHVGFGLPKMHALDHFAPYRRRLKAWPFYYRAADPDLDKALQNPAVWDPSLFDGDASFD